MASSRYVECDLINAADGRKIRSVRLSVVPQRGDEFDLDLGPNHIGTALYRIMGVRYHVQPRKVRVARLRRGKDDLIGVSVFVTQVG